MHQVGKSFHISNQNARKNYPKYITLFILVFFFILAINQLNAQNLFYSKFISSLYMFRKTFAHLQEVRTVLYSLWYHHTETSEWSKITKITKITKIYKYVHIVIKFMCEFFGRECDN